MKSELLYDSAWKPGKSGEEPKYHSIEQVTTMVEHSSDIMGEGWFAERRRVRGSNLGWLLMPPNRSLLQACAWPCSQLIMEDKHATLRYDNGILRYRSGNLEIEILRLAQIGVDEELPPGTRLAPQNEIAGAHKKWIIVPIEICTEWTLHKK